MARKGDAGMRQPGSYAGMVTRSGGPGAGSKRASPNRSAKKGAGSTAMGGAPPSDAGAGAGRSRTNRGKNTLTSGNQGFRG